ncbi:hypothetical protein SDC9_114217 [bioreactor metagenome]|uniref:Uncharacterized protein n=1 Tax=bioreactor metagenome TaxID=1076179 RepID=A0A645BPT4_9ZZZZ
MEPPHQNHIHDADRKFVVEHGVLRHVADAFPRLFGFASEHGDAAGLRLEQAQNQAEERTFAAAVGTDDGHRFTGADGQINSFQHRHRRLVGEGKTFDFDDFVRHGFSAISWLRQTGIDLPRQLFEHGRKIALQNIDWHHPALNGGADFFRAARVELPLHQNHPDAVAAGGGDQLHDLPRRRILAAFFDGHLPDSVAAAEITECRMVDVKRPVPVWRQQCGDAFVQRGQFRFQRPAVGRKQCFAFRGKFRQRLRHISGHELQVDRVEPDMGVFAAFVMIVGVGFSAAGQGEFCRFRRNARDIFRAGNESGAALALHFPDQLGFKGHGADQKEYPAFGDGRDLLRRRGIVMGALAIGNEYGHDGVVACDPLRQIGLRRDRYGDFQRFSRDSRSGRQQDAEPSGDDFFHTHAFCFLPPHSDAAVFSGGGDWCS